MLEREAELTSQCSKLRDTLMEQNSTLHEYYERMSEDQRTVELLKTEKAQ